MPGQNHLLHVLKFWSWASESSFQYREFCWDFTSVFHFTLVFWIFLFCCLGFFYHKAVTEEGWFSATWSFHFQKWNWVLQLGRNIFSHTVFPIHSGFATVRTPHTGWSREQLDLMHFQRKKLFCVNVFKVLKKHSLFCQLAWLQSFSSIPFHARSIVLHVWWGQEPLEQLDEWIWHPFIWTCSMLPSCHARFMDWIETCQSPVVQPWHRKIQRRKTGREFCVCVFEIHRALWGSRA